ncbi:MULTISPECIES: flagellar assembly protein FliW [unclassified Lebetimonas]|uniref:flagellar assembly protein FliW n=1 Tax=unclassified Lebetimonas TaxID=2648158 RepID=UPI0004656E5E|nr:MULTISPECIES: flagellar assembly protein FliW [unclassified Lebetimonas]
MEYKVALPVLGFENIDKFELEEIEPNFFKLQNGNISFTLINPAVLREDYFFEIDEDAQKKLKLNENSNYFVLNIMIINKPFVDSTINFAAPVIFNNDEKIMGQVILDKYPYSLSDPLRNYIKEKK